jgi:hypothetical protein
MLCKVHCIITLFNVGNVVLFVIYQLRLYRIYVCYTDITLCITFGIIRGFT